VGAVTIASQMGVQFRPTANFCTIPKETSEVALEWIEEGSAPSDGALTFGILHPSMKTGAVVVDFTRLLELQGTPLVDPILTSMFLRAIGRGVDHAIFHGPGTDGAPLGVAATPDVSTQDGSTFSIAKVAALLKAVEDGGADTSSVSFCMDPATAEKLRTRAKVTGGRRMIFEDGRILDRPGYVSTGIDAGTIFYGFFPDLVVLVREIDLLFNPYTRGRQGVRQHLGFWYGDLFVQHSGYFALATVVS
jgi:HK97 family phage major capsid protein